MKTVFNNSMCTHVWAQRSQAEGRSDSMRFTGDVLYSYATPIANFTPEGVALISSHSYSATTNGKHIPEARHAVRGRSFTVPDIGASGGRASSAIRWPASDPTQWIAVHTNNLAWMVRNYRDEVERQFRKVQWYADDRASVVECLTGEYSGVQDARDYARTFGLPEPEFPIEADADRIWSKRERLNAKRADPKYAAKSEKVREQREAAKARKEERERLTKWVRETEMRANWINGASSYYRGTDEHGGAYLRVHGDEVETSLGASVPLEDARRVFNIIEANRPNHPTWKPGSKGPKLGHFTLDSWDEKGIRAGCHFISWSEIERIAPALNDGVPS